MLCKNCNMEATRKLKANDYCQSCYEAAEYEATRYDDEEHREVFYDDEQDA